jgi:hypothetical protein
MELEPLASALTHHTTSYHLRLRSVLFAAAGRGDIQFLVLPSFEPELLLSIRRHAAGVRARVVRPQWQIWQVVRDEQPAAHDPPCRVADKAMSEPQFVRLQHLWRAMLLRARFADARRVSLDGTSYVFLDGHHAAKTHMPEPGTRPHALAEIGLLLVQWTEAGPADEDALPAQLDTRLDALETALAHADDPPAGAEGGAKK